MHAICKWQLGGITIRQVHPSINLMLHDFHSSIDKQDPLMSFGTMCLIYGF
jgi:hypothetical protein